MIPGGLAMPGGGLGVPLDGLSPTGAFSMSRKLLSAYGGSFYTVTGAGVSTFNDQSGSARDLTQGTDANRPPATTAGSNGRACADFQNDDLLISAAAMSTFITTTTGYMIASVIVDAIDTNSSTSFSNDCILGDDMDWVGVYLKSTGPTVISYNWDTNDDNIGNTISTGAVLVIEWRHESGTLYNRVNGGTWASVASGTTGDALTGSKLNVGKAGGAYYFDGKLFEAALFSTIPTAARQDALVSNFKTWAGT